MKYLLLAEWITGVIALLLTAMAFTDLSWGEGASSQEMKRAAMAKCKRLFMWAGGFWAITILCFLCLR
jgi:hypothetical protein